MNVRNKSSKNNNKEKTISQNLRKLKMLSFFKSTVFLCVVVIIVSVLLMVVIFLCFDKDTIVYDVGNGFLISAVASAAVALILEYRNAKESKKRRYAILMNSAIAIEEFNSRFNNFNNSKHDNIAEEIKEMSMMLALPIQCIRECANSNSNDLDLIESKMIQTINYLSRYSFDLIDHSKLYKLEETDIRSIFVKDEKSAYSIESYSLFLRKISDAFVFLYTKWKCEGIIPGGNESAK